ncbi:GNAT family N-acetyltransferase [Arthrobacter sp. CAU 1506]|uniref:GNAT family N-acetyltransferase n=1 Tax=Arthrobacter sp. CAU 1506 TaxID=2560052 RepID=UPI0010AC2755|nr:GNAT family N-acetyltransferase [Arthrobacter sp. CAU 1506]TJY69857.1 GNAT family N-acetyltransferase [Arthrobacter sp. CAU 1506]
MGNEYTTDVPDDVLSVWVAGWSACRGYSSEEVSGHPAVLLADKTGDWEYFAFEPGDEEFAAVARDTTKSSGRIFTVLTRNAQRIHELAPQHGLRVHHNAQSLMVTDMSGQDAEDPWYRDADFKTELEKTGSVHRVRVVHEGNEAAHGVVAVVDNVAVFDHIETDINYRRRGLATHVMRALIASTFEHMVDTGLLIASHDGQMLYNHLGWDTVCDVMILKPATEN